MNLIEELLALQAARGYLDVSDLRELADRSRVPLYEIEAVVELLPAPAPQSPPPRPRSRSAAISAAECGERSGTPLGSSPCVQNVRTPISSASRVSGGVRRRRRVASTRSRWPPKRRQRCSRRRGQSRPSNRHCPRPGAGRSTRIPPQRSAMECCARRSRTTAGAWKTAV